MTDVAKLWVKINETLKGQVIRPMKEEKSHHAFLPTGIVDLDLKLGGGWCCGGLNVLYGKESSGKSLLALLAVAACQSFCRKCFTPFSAKVKCECKKCESCKALYVDAENSWTNDWSEKFGIKPEDVYVGHPRHMQEAFDIVDAFIREEAVDLIVLDSVAALAPKEEREATMEEWQTGVVPRVYTKFLRKWAMDLQDLVTAGKKLPAAIFINQIRMKMGVAYGNPEIMPGGEAQKFFAQTIVRVTKKSIEMSPDERDPQPLYQTVKFAVEKSKVSPVKREGLLDIPINNYLDEKGVLHRIGKVENEKTLVDYARTHRVIEKKGAKYVFGDRMFDNLNSIEQTLREDLAFRWTLFKAVNKAYADFVPSAVKLKPENDEEKEE